MLYILMLGSAILEDLSTAVEPVCSGSGVSALQSPPLIHFEPSSTLMLSKTAERTIAMFQGFSVG